jgi:hypothetical protein
MNPPESVLYFANGPFYGSIDPWAEDPFYFSQLHSGIIAAILSQIWGPLIEMGYVASKEASLQIAELRKPDIAFFTASEKTKSQKRLDYSAAASAILAEPGISVDIGEPEYQAIFIRHAESGTLVTVVEVISPRNKAYLPDIVKYQEGRRALFLERGVNVVEIDATRSVKRLLEHSLTTQFPYHIAIFMPGESPRAIPIEFLAPLKRCALPLLDDVIGVELQTAYEIAYREATIAPQLENNRQYALEHLPFPSLLTAEQTATVLAKIEAWRAELKHLKNG